MPEANTPRKIRTLRHWRQRFNPNARFVWRKGVTWRGETVVAGTPIPEDLANDRAKLHRFWQAGVVELAEFEDANALTGTVLSPAESLVRQDGPETFSVDGIPGKTWKRRATALRNAEKLIESRGG